MEQNKLTKEQVELFTKQAEEEMRKAIEEQPKPNVLICGQTGSGKSSAINYIAEEKIAEVGDVVPNTIGIEYKETNFINVYDSEGYEIGSDKQAHYIELIMDFLKSHKDFNKKEAVHLIWYCISGAGKKYTNLDKDLINKMKEEGFKVCVLITKIDEMTKEQFNQLFDSIKKDYANIDIFKLSIKEDYEKISDWENLIKWSCDNLKEVFKDRFLSGLMFQYGLKEKEKHAKTIINGAVTAAAGVAVAPIPMPDAPALIGIQTVMCVKILSTYNIKVGNKTILAVIQSSLISNLGKWLVGWILKFIPGGSLINASIAAGITKALGNTLLYFADKYTRDKSAGEKWVETFEDVLNSVDFINQFKDKFKDEKDKTEEE